MGLEVSPQREPVWPALEHPALTHPCCQSHPAESRELKTEAVCECESVCDAGWPAFVVLSQALSCPDEPPWEVEVALPSSSALLCGSDPGCSGGPCLLLPFPGL